MANPRTRTRKPKAPPTVCCAKTPAWALTWRFTLARLLCCIR